jgi:cysteine desulfurase/selenocysteine lyase
MTVHQQPTARAYDVDAIRRDFPILSREVYGKPLVYLDNGASAQKPQAVIDAVTHAYSQEYANVHRGLHFLSNAATDAYEAARGKVQRFLNAASTDEIVFTKSTTEAINTVAYGYGMPNIGEGDEIVLTIMEHHSNIVPWHFIRERQGAKLVWVPVDDHGAFDLAAFEASLSERTKLVAITHMSNVLGTVVPVKEVCRIAHARGIPVLVDGSQAAVHMPIDVRDIDCDWYVFTGHKVYGPSGIGVLYGKRDILASMRPFQGGGEMIVDVGEDAVSYNEPPHRFEAGTPPIVQAIGLGAALDYMENVGREAIAAHEASLTAYAGERLRSVNALRIIGDAAGKGAIFSFEIEGVHAHDVSMVIDRSGVAVRAGTHCAQPLLKRFGVTSTCRASFGMYNTHAEIDALVEALEKARAFFG